ncbi:hypothetical protein GZ77_18295 [Endozoicomonas montiporae]|uniref:Peptidase A2 domain-containing protein n=3 Tax=Endozoicomonas montiporae TaxID=1027273 RepID=A0A081N1Z9_9GAMM|nr:hypothetical protein EZMO1_4670 [Endozoicomonas montiporae CL-33]KEQ12472.1 hypothetical protein GZ77_18295 [Endozoicomonas montiporae]
MLGTGIIAGWWLHHQQPQSVSQNSSNPSFQLKWHNPHSNPGTFHVTEPLWNSTTTEELSMFLMALDENRIDDALVIYQQNERSGSAVFNLLQQNLKEWLSQQDAQISISVLERITQHYYQDERLLTQLVSLYEHQGRLEPAIVTLINLKSFTDNSDTRSGLDERIHLLSRTFFNQQLQLDQLETLLALFQRLSAQEMDYGFYRFALSQIYLATGDNGSAIRELEVLQTHSEFGRQASQQLMALLPPPPVDEEEELPASAIALTPRGGHFLVDVSAGTKETVRLLIDTGASLTTLPSEFLQRLRRKKLAARVGHTHLKTAGGEQFAPIYLLKELHIGHFIVRNLQVAELDLFELGSEGLLGMDVLSQFRFHLDQDKSTLTLHQR